MFGNISAVTLSVIFCLSANIFTHALCVVVLSGQEDSPISFSYFQDTEGMNKKSELKVHAVEKRSPHYYDDEPIGRQSQGFIVIDGSCIANGLNCLTHASCCSGRCKWKNWWDAYSPSRCTP